MGPVVTVVLLIYQQTTGRAPTWGWFAAIVASGLAWHFYTELKNARSATKPEPPKLFLRYDQRQDKSIDSSGFFLQVEGDKRAFDVKMTSEPVVGQHRSRINMQWELPGGAPIGSTACPVHAYCVRYEKDIVHSMGGISGRQIHKFFEQKKDLPNELEVTITYKDVGGHPWSKRFKITSGRNYSGNFDISCVPLVA